MDMAEFLGLFKPMHLRNLITLLQESGQTIYTNAHNYQIIGGVKQGLETSQFSEERVLQHLPLESLAEVLISLPRISETGIDNAVLNILTQAGVLTPSFCPHCQKENANEARHCIWCGKGFPNRYCENCRTRNIVEAMYCMECGQVR